MATNPEMSSYLKETLAKEEAAWHVVNTVIFKDFPEETD